MLVTAIVPENLSDDDLRTIQQQWPTRLGIRRPAARAWPARAADTRRRPRRPATPGSASAAALDVPWRAPWRDPIGSN
jgi:hypothetical protein